MKVRGRKGEKKGGIATQYDREKVKGRGGAEIETEKEREE